MCTATNKNRNHTKQMIMKKDSRSSLNMLPMDFEPSNNDVLCGRGNVYSNHYGNQFFGKVIRDNITVYKEATSRPDKIKVVDGILDQIRDNGARFTKVDTQTERWYELNDVQAHQKIGHAIRDTIRLLRKGGNNNNNNSIITTSNNYTTPKEEKTRAIRTTRRTSKSLVAKKKMFQQQKRQSRITIQREQLRQLVRSLDDEYVLEQQENDDHYFSSQSLLPSVSSTFTLLEGYITNNNKESFLLEDEFPEHQFSFKASHFFERNNNDDGTINNDSNILSQ